jgi:antirestriction protein ArdC
MPTDDKTAELLSTMADKIATLTTSEAWQAWLDTQARFHSYSFGNVMLIMAQCPEASQVAGFRTWQGLGRQVRRGEHGLRILAPMSWKRTDDDGTEHRGIRGFRGVAVFDISQTDGEPLPAHPCQLLTDTDDSGLFDRLAKVAIGLGFSVSDAPASGMSGANGYTRHADHSIVVCADRSPLQRAKTLAHEIGHAILHAPEDFDYHNRRALAELEAESVAYVVCQSVGLVTDDYSLGYVATWNRDHAPELIKASGERIAKASKIILTALEG